MALKFGLDGIYIPSFNKQFKHLSYNLKKNFKIVGSAHNLKEIRIKELQKAEKIFLSSIFKKNKNYLGIYKFRNICICTKKDIVALGGISHKNLKKLNFVNVNEYSGISCFE